MSVIDSILKHEGFSAKPYIDVLAKDRIPEASMRVIEKYFDDLKITFGYGMTFIDEDTSRYFVAKQVDAIEVRLITLRPVFRSLPPEARNVLIEMAYQMGVDGLNKFRKMWIALENFDFETAADEMTDSAWFTQTPNRAIELSERMRAIDWEAY